jgi:hypothetical protein
MLKTVKKFIFTRPTYQWVPSEEIIFAFHLPADWISFYGRRVYGKNSSIAADSRLSSLMDESMPVD